MGEPGEPSDHWNFQGRYKQTKVVIQVIGRNLIDLKAIFWVGGIVRW